MRQYRYEATEETVEALRVLRGAWVGIRVERNRVTVRLADAREVRLDVERTDAEDALEVSRIRAAVGTDEGQRGAQYPHEAPFQDTPDFAVGRNDVVLFAGATWIERGMPAEQKDAGVDAQGASRPAEAPAEGGDQVLQFSGHPGQIPESAAAVCLTTDAVVVATPVGTGFLIRTGLQPRALEVSDDPGTLDRFLRERGYRSSGSGG